LQYVGVQSEALQYVGIQSEALQYVGIQSEALQYTLEFKAKLCSTRWSSKRSFAVHVGVQSEALFGRSKLRFELQRNAMRISRTTKPK
jgi:hypothetical protein